ncbi:MAG: hypothetical protein IT521_02455 [Burkholderiales bacterium]|nr:hypothetical protein [Burkholderiales bacterium]
MMATKHPDGSNSPPPAVVPELGADGTERVEDQELAFWWDFSLDEDALLRDVARWDNVPTPTALDLAAREVGLPAARAALAEHQRRGEFLKREGGTAAPTITAATNPGTNAEDVLAEWYDPVTHAELETMFPADGQWKNWAERASDNGLKAARVARARFNPYRAAQWFLHRGIPGWDQARVDRVLANNLPPRSQHQREFLAL